MYAVVAHELHTRIGLEDRKVDADRGQTRAPHRGDVRSHEHRRDASVLRFLVLQPVGAAAGLPFFSDCPN